MAAELRPKICEAMEEKLKEALTRAGKNSWRFEMGIDFQAEDIAFLTTIYFSHLKEMGYRVFSGGVKNRGQGACFTTCHGLCQHVDKDGYYVVSL